jgi:ATP-dependent Clp protease adaptor protein ClpS
MSETDQPESTTGTLERTDTKPRFAPHYHVILLNDDYHSMPFVVMVIQKTIRCSLARAEEIMFEAHQRGRSILWTGCLEQAELKQEQVHSFREDEKGPLGCVLEPAA